MIVIAAALLAQLLLAVPQTAVPQPSTPTAPTWTPEQLEGIREKEAEIQKQREPARQQAIHINDLAGNIHSEAEARAYVDAVAEVLTGHRHMLWTTRSIRRRVAHAEYEAVTDPARQIPEQRIVDVWNEYVREIDAPAEALVTVAELHNLRDSMYVGASRFAWKREINQSIWTMPNIYALDADGKIASGCRALETLKIIHDMHDQFQNVRADSEGSSRFGHRQITKSQSRTTPSTKICRSRTSRCSDEQPDPCCHAALPARARRTCLSAVIAKTFCRVIPGRLTPIPDTPARASIPKASNRNSTSRAAQP